MEYIENLPEPDYSLNSYNFIKQKEEKEIKEEKENKIEFKKDDNFSLNFFMN